MKNRIEQNNRTLRIGNDYKAQAIRDIIANGYNVRKRGWPDIIASLGGNVRCVYIVRGNSDLSHAQSDMMALLQRGGIRCTIERI